MADTELSSKLYEKMSAEQDKFRAWLTSQPPADILLHAVEYVVREDILMEMDSLEPFPVKRTQKVKKKWNDSCRTRYQWLGNEVA